MRYLTLIINLVSILIILITPGYFRNDHIVLLDIIVVVLLIIYSCCLFINRSIRKVLLLNSFLALIYCVFTTSYGIEDEHRFNRLYWIFSISDQQLLLSPVAEWVSAISFLLFVILGVFMVFRLLLGTRESRLSSK